MSKREIPCLCEKTFEAEVPEEVSLGDNPGQIEKILSGDFLVLECPHCGKKLTPEFPIRFTHPASGQDFLMIPEEDRSDFYHGRYPLAKGLQCVIGYSELVERLRVIRDGLDVRAVEALKYVFQAKAEESNPEAEPAVSYHDSEGGDLSFWVTGLVKDKVGKVRANRKQYEQILSDMDKIAGSEPYASFLKPPYVSLRALESEG